MPELEQDAWLPTRLAKLGVFIEVEKKIYDAYTTMIRDWLEGIAESVLEGGVNPLGVYSMTSKWLDKITEFAQKVITWALGKAYQWALGESYEFTNRPFVQQYIEESKNRLVKTPDQVYEKVKAAVATGTAEGQSIPEIAKQIKTDLLDSGAPYWKNRAVTVARTETIGAYNGGANDAFGVIVGEFPEDEFEKIWLATDDTRTRHTHNEADGQRVSYSADFSVGGHQMGFPGDPRGPAEEVINCRCTMLLVEHGEEVDYSNKGFKGLTASVSTLPPPQTAPALIAAAVPFVKPDLAALIAAAWISGDWKLHATCSTTFCRTPLHPGPCKGWKHTLKKVAPGVYDALEAARIAKLEAKRKAKVTALKDAGKPIPSALLKKITSLPTKAGPYDPTPDQKPLSDATEKKLADVAAKTKKAFEKKAPATDAEKKLVEGMAHSPWNHNNEAILAAFDKLSREDFKSLDAPTRAKAADLLKFIGNNPNVSDDQRQKVIDISARWVGPDATPLPIGTPKQLDVMKAVQKGGYPEVAEAAKGLTPSELSGLPKTDQEHIKKAIKMAAKIAKEKAAASGPIDGDGDGKLNEGDEKAIAALPPGAQLLVNKDGKPVAAKNSFGDFMTWKGDAWITAGPTNQKSLKEMLSNGDLKPAGYDKEKDLALLKQQYEKGQMTKAEYEFEKANIEAGKPTPAGQPIIPPSDITDAANNAAMMAFAPSNFTQEERIEAYGELTQADVDSMNTQDTSNLIDDVLALQAQGLSPAKAKTLDKVYDLISKQAFPDQPAGKKADLFEVFGPDGNPDHKQAVDAIEGASQADWNNLPKKEKLNVLDHLEDAQNNGEPGAKEALAKVEALMLSQKKPADVGADAQGVDSAALPTSSVDPDKIGKLDGPNDAAVKQALDVTNNTYKYSFDQIIGAYTELTKKDFDSLTKVDQKTIAEKVKGFASSPILTEAQRNKAASLATSLGSKYPHGSSSQVALVKALANSNAANILKAAENLTADEYTGLAEVHQQGIKDAVKVGINNPDLTNSATAVGLAFLGGKPKPTINIPSVNAIANDANSGGTSVNAISPAVPAASVPAALTDHPAVTQVKNVFDDDSKATAVAQFYAAKALTKEQFIALPVSFRVKVRKLLNDIAAGKGDPKYFVPGDKEKANEVYKKLSLSGSNAPDYVPTLSADEDDVLAKLMNDVPVVPAPPPTPAAAPPKDPAKSFEEWQTKKTAVVLHSLLTNAGKIAEKIKDGTVSQRLDVYTQYAGTKAKFTKLPEDVQDAIVADLDNIYEGAKKGFFTPDQSSAAVNLRFALTGGNPMTVFTPKPTPAKKTATGTPGANPATKKKLAALSMPAQLGYDTVNKVGDGDPLARLSAYQDMTKDDFESLPATTQKKIATDLGNMGYATSMAWEAKTKEYTADFGGGGNFSNRKAAQDLLEKLIGKPSAKGWKPKTKAQIEYEKLGDAMFTPGDGSSGTLGSSDAAVWDKKVAIGLKGISAQKAAPADMTNSNSGYKWNGVYSNAKFTGEQMFEAVQDYKGSGYTNMNTHLRNSKGKLQDSEFWGSSYTSGLTYQNTVRAIDDVMKKSRLQSPIVSYRGFGSPEKVFAGVYNGGATDLTGMEFTDYGFQSTSTSVKKAEDFAGVGYGDPNQHIVLKIFTPKGYGAIKVSGPEYENEILLDRSTRYRIVRDNGIVGGARRLDVEVIGPGENG